MAGYMDMVDSGYREIFRLVEYLKLISYQLGCQPRWPNYETSLAVIFCRPYFFAQHARSKNPG